MQIQPCGPLRGEITVPGDKSISHRAVMLGALANGTTHAKVADKQKNAHQQQRHKSDFPFNAAVLIFVLCFLH